MKQTLALFSAIATLSLCVGTGQPARAEGISLTKSTVGQLSAAMENGELTSEQLVEQYLARVKRFDKEGPRINSIIRLNQEALAHARALDIERAISGPRSVLHGIPVLLKDNIDTHDMPTTSGSQLLDGSFPPDDAYVVTKLLRAGAIILGKTNLSEFAGGGSVGGSEDSDVREAARVPDGYSSLGGQTRNPHDLTRGPSFSSGGSAAAIAAGFAQMSLGTDTGGSVRGPASANGVVGLRPTLGLVSRDGIMPLALSLDTPGPIARNVYDVAAILGVITGPDEADRVTIVNRGRAFSDYTQFLAIGSLRGARLGLAREFLGQHEGRDVVVRSALDLLKELGAELVDIEIPSHIMAVKQPLYDDIARAEFRSQVTDYLRTLKPDFPQSFGELVSRANDPATQYRSPAKAFALKYVSSRGLDLKDPRYTAIKGDMLPSFKSSILMIFQACDIDAIVYPTMPSPASLILAPDALEPKTDRGGGGGFGTVIASLSGLPDLAVPAGMTDNDLPVSISFIGREFSEPMLLAYAFDFEQAANAVRSPHFTPDLDGPVVDASTKGDGHLRSVR